MKRLTSLCKRIIIECKTRGLKQTIVVIIKALKNAFKRNGIKGMISQLGESSALHDVLSEYSYVTEKEIIELNDSEAQCAKENNDKLLVNWLIPDLGVGASGGITTIFRFVKIFEQNGFHNRIFIIDKKARVSSEEYLKNFIAKNYGIKITDSEIYSNDENISFAHITIATSWQTAYYLRRYNNTSKKYYFIQDYEPSFYPMGTDYILAQNTYKFGFEGIFAGNWLEKKLVKEYSMHGICYNLTYESSEYKLNESHGVIDKVLFYSRPSTSRRCFEIGLLALNELKRTIPDVKVGFFGEDVSNYRIPFEHKNYGYLTTEGLSKLYDDSTVCLVLSPTNLSLIPLEASAAGAIVAVNMGENNDWGLENKRIIHLTNNPVEIAETLYNVFSKQIGIDDDITNNDVVPNKDVSWEQEILKVASYLIKELKESS